MKTCRLALIIIYLFIGLLLISGCATTGNVKDPGKSDSTLVIGRIKLVCNDFPKEWRINGEHTRNLRVYFVDPKTEDKIKVKPKGKDGVFYLVDPAAKRYYLVGFETIIKHGNWTLKNYHRIKNTYIDITKNSINNLGDIIWYETFTGQTERGGGSSTFTKVGRHEFILNNDEVETCFMDEFTKSPWLGKNCIDVKYIEH